jgi:hypothetical protein
MAEQHAGDQRGERAVNDNRAQSSGVKPPVAQAPPPQPTRRQRWQVARPTKMITFWLCLGAIVLTMIIGFTWGGWKTADAAQKQTNSAVQVAVVQRLAGICVAQFGGDAGHAANLAELQALGTSARASYMSDGGWSTMPGEASSDTKITSECVKQVISTASK